MAKAKKKTPEQIEKERKRSKYYVRDDGLHEAIRIINGKRKAFRGNDDSEVEQKMIAYMGEIETGRLFKMIAEDWEAAHFPTLAANTLKSYRPAYERAKAEFGETPIRQIKAPDIKRYINDFARGKKAHKTVTNQLLILNLIFGYAAECGDIEYNPCTSVNVPKDLPRKRREAATPEDEAKVKASADLWLFPFLILYTGLRRGEALALTWGDIDKKNAEIHVTKSLYHEDGTYYIKKPKTSAGTRTIPLLDPLAEKLPKKLGAPGEYVFSIDGGKSPLSEAKILTMWRQYARATGVTATPHQLRHSYATMLFECGIDVKDAQDLLGHSTIAMTQDIYTHVREKHRKDTASILNKKLSENTETTQ